MQSSNLLKSKIPILRGGGRVGWWNQLSTFHAKFKFAKIQNSHFGGVGETNFQLLMLSSNLLKSKIPILGGRGGWWNQLSTFDAEFKFAKIQNSYFGGVGCTNFQLLILSSNLLKSKIPISGGGGRGWWNQLSTFDAEFKFAKIQNSHFWGGEGLV